MSYNDEIEVPDDFIVSDEKERLMTLSLNEYNKYINMGKLEARKYYIQCIIRRLENPSGNAMKESVSSIYDKLTNSIQAKEGYTFNDYKFRFEKVKQ